MTCETLSPPGRAIYAPLLHDRSGDCSCMEAPDVYMSLHVPIGPETHDASGSTKFLCHSGLAEVQPYETY